MNERPLPPSLNLSKKKVILLPVQKLRRLSTDSLRRAVASARRRARVAIPRGLHVIAILAHRVPNLYSTMLGLAAS